MGSYGPSASSCGQRRLSSDWTDAGITDHFAGFVMRWIKFPCCLDPEFSDFHLCFLFMFFFFFSECCELLKKVLEPCLDLRLPLSEMQTHPWVTQHNKVPFHTFQHLPKDKLIKSLVSFVCDFDIYRYTLVVK